MQVSLASQMCIYTWPMLSTSPICICAANKPLSTWGIQQDSGAIKSREVSVVDLEEEAMVWAIRTGKDFL